MAELPVRMHPPDPWPAFRARVKHRWLRPLLFSEWAFQHAAYWLGRWSLLEVLEYVGRFSVLVAVILYFAESGEREQQKHYQAWQVINTAQGKGGNGGRIDALEQLSHDGLSLTGVDGSLAFLQGVRLPGAELRRAVLHAADLRDANLSRASLADADFTSANLRNADLRYADLSGANFDSADLTGADLSHANLDGASFNEADLTGANLGDVENWRSAKFFGSTELKDVKNAPPGLAAPPPRSTRPVSTAAASHPSATEP